MKPGQLLIAFVAVVAVAAALVFSGGGDDGGGGSGASDGPVERAPAGSVVVSFAYSPEKEELLLPLVEEFNASGAEAGGKRVFVEAVNRSSGEVEAEIAEGAQMGAVSDGMAAAYEEA